MADLATPSGAAMFDGGSTAEKKTIEKPEKPNEEAHKANLKKAEKEHADAMAKFVSGHFPSVLRKNWCRHRETACTYIDLSDSHRMLSKPR